MPSKINKRRKPFTAETEPTLLSDSSILILSGFLVGIVCGNMVDPRIEFYVYLSGVVGMISYFALGHVSRRRSEIAERRAWERACEKMEGRIDRHVPRFRPARKMRPFHARPKHVEQQYVPVVNSQRRPMQKSLHS